MSELLEFDEESWNNLTEMVKSPDDSTRKLAFGMLKGIDYTNTDQMNSFEEFMYVSMGLDTLITTKGQIIHTYFSLLSKSNGNGTSI